MADLTHTPYKGLRTPTVPLDDTAYTGGLGLLYGVCTGLFPYTEGGGRTPTSYNASTRLGRHCAMTFDVNASSTLANRGVYLQLWTLGDSDLTAANFHASSQKLQETTGISGNLGTANRGNPDGVWMLGTLFHADGKANMLHPGIRDPESLFVDDGGVFTDETTDAADDNDLYDVSFATLGSINDAIYVGSDQTYRAILIHRSNFSTAGTTTWEYWNGATWAAATVTAVAAGGTTFASGYLVTVPGNWATTTVNGVSRYWLRLRWTAGGATSGGWSRVWIARVATYTHLAPAAYHVSDDPGTQTPDVIPWGIDAWWPIGIGFTNAGVGALENLDGLNDTAPGAAISTIDRLRVVYYDSVRDIESPWYETAMPTNGVVTTFSLIGTLQANVDTVRVYGRAGAAGGTNLWYRMYLGAANSRNTEATATHGATITVRGVSSTTDPMTDQAAGPHHATDGDMDNVGGPTTVTTLRRRVWAAGATQTNSEDARGFANTVKASAIGKPHQFPAAYHYPVDPDDGDEIVAIEAVDDALLIWKHWSIHLLTGEPGSGTVQVRRVIGGIGLAAKRARKVVGNLCYFLAQDGLRVIDGAGTLQPMPDSEDVAPMFAALTTDAIHQACLEYLPSTRCLYLAVPGLQGQFSDSAPADPDAVIDINDGMFVYHLPTGQWAVWGGVYAASLAAVPNSSQSLELWVGDYWGMVWRFTEDTLEGAGSTPTGYTISGTVTAATSNTLDDSAATWPLGSTDRRLLHNWVWITSGTGAGQVRKIVGTRGSTPRLSVAPNWDATPGVGATYRIGNLYAAIESGDLDLSDPAVEKALDKALIYLENVPDTDNTLDVALATGEVNDFAAPSYNDGVTRFEYGGAGADSTKRPVVVSLPAVAALTQRVRVACRIADTRPRIRAMTLEGRALGRPYGG